MGAEGSYFRPNTQEDHMENENTPYPGISDQFVGDGGRYGETDKSLVTKQEANLFNAQEAEIAAFISVHLGVEAAKVTREAKLIDDLGADSLDVVELVMEAEERWHVEISDDEADEIKTVGDCFKVIATATAHEADATIRPVR